MNLQINKGLDSEIELYCVLYVTPGTETYVNRIKSTPDKLFSVYNQKTVEAL